MRALKERAFVERNLPSAPFSRAAEAPTGQIPLHVSTAARARNLLIEHMAVEQKLLANCLIEKNVMQFIDRWEHFKKAPCHA